MPTVTVTVKDAWLNAPIVYQDTVADPEDIKMALILMATCVTIAIVDLKIMVRELSGQPIIVRCRIDPGGFYPYSLHVL